MRIMEDGHFRRELLQNTALAQNLEAKLETSGKLMEPDRDKRGALRWQLGTGGDRFKWLEHLLARRVA
jgi:hypothetical protein